MALPGFPSGAAEDRHQVVGRRAVFVDRDGVINRSIVRNGRPYAPDSLAGLEILPGVPQALAAFRAAGYLNIVVTNQPDVGAGKLPLATVQAMSSHLMATLPLDSVKVCYHTEKDECECRKPKAGLLLEAAAQFDIDLSTSYMVGDRWRDVGAAHVAGCRAFFIDYSYDERRPDPPYVRVESLAEAAALILKTRRSDSS